MMRLQWLINFVLSAIVALAVVPRAGAQGQASFDVFIPQKLLAGQFPNPTLNSYPQIGGVIARFSLFSGGSVTFKITDVTNGASLTVTSTSTIQTLTFASGDFVTLQPLPDPNDPNRFEMKFTLRQNSMGNCQAINGTSHYKVEVTSGPLIVGVCLESLDGLQRPGTATTCSTQNLDAYVIPIPLDNPNDMVATLNSPPASNQPSATGGCFNQRPPVDVLLVLDKSGSMAAQTSALGPTRMDALHAAVRNFVGVWSSLPPTSGDQIGAVLFDTTSPTQPAITNFPISLKDMTLSTTATNVPNWVDVVTPGGSTSIGAGLHQADNLFASNNHRKVVLLMSDGQQNTEPFVKGDGGLYCTAATDSLCVAQSLQSCSFASPCPLSNHPKLYTVTVGPSGSVDPAIAQAIANGFYLNTETNYPLLSPFFLELLQNFLRFNSYETVRIVSAHTSYSATLPLSTTSLNVAFSVTWPSHEPLRLTITPPGGTQPIVKESQSGLITFFHSLPLSAPFDPRGDWKIEVNSINPGSTSTPDGVPFDLHIMSDDIGIKTDLAVVPQDYKSGDKIRLRAKLTRFGLPIPGLDSHQGDQIRADLIKPGQSVGDMLSDSAASSQSANPDIQSGAEAKLFNAVQNDPSVLKRIPDTTQLFDDGKQEHGDDVAGDGIYSAFYPATLPGHYNFVFSVQGTDPNFLRFSRQQLRTVYVRPVPDAGNTIFQTSILRRDNGNVLSIVMTPRFKPGPGCRKSDPKCGRMGLGWADFFWFTSPGIVPFKAADNLNGSYTATLAFSGAVPPPVTVHFEDVVAVIPDSTTVDKLPQPLGPGNVLTNVPPPCCAGVGKIALFLDAGAGIPHGAFGSAFNTGFSFNTGLEYIATNHFSAEGIFGYHRFPATAGSALDLYQFSANGKLYLASSGPLRPFANAGAGGYKFSPGSTYFGGNFGAGLLYELTAHWGLQASYNFHAINTPLTAKFSDIEFGVHYQF
jgi:hypothetical protein